MKLPNATTAPTSPEPGPGGKARKTEIRFTETFIPDGVIP
jgi:hypothetical protein